MQPYPNQEAPQKPSKGLAKETPAHTQVHTLSCVHVYAMCPHVYTPKHNVIDTTSESQATSLDCMNWPLRNAPMELGG